MSKFIRPLLVVLFAQVITSSSPCRAGDIVKDLQRLRAHTDEALRQASKQDAELRELIHLIGKDRMSRHLANRLGLFYNFENPITEQHLLDAAENAHKEKVQEFRELLVRAAQAAGAAETVLKRIFSIPDPDTRERLVSKLAWEYQAHQGKGGGIETDLRKEKLQLLEEAIRKYGGDELLCEVKSRAQLDTGERYRDILRTFEDYAEGVPRAKLHEALEKAEAASEKLATARSQYAETKKMLSKMSSEELDLRLRQHSRSIESLQNELREAPKKIQPLVSSFRAPEIAFHEHFKEMLEHEKTNKLLEVMKRLKR